MMYYPKYFKVHELVDGVTYYHFNGSANRIISLFDGGALMVLDWLRMRYGACTVNNWMNGGGYSWSGLRNPNSPWYSAYSQHTFGRAFDCKFKKASAEEVRLDLQKNYPQEGLDIPVTFENGVSWFHFDVRQRKHDIIGGFNP